ncbi:pilus assembly protein [Lederbergia sp. NSJ-179]|uniref:TadE/TadG family type IV pilus assembly protein n=1 Tax=Lederbergia sp. NSJ-179 TaxID=2931402 RepID=UPI001FD46FDF|nr:TadE family protein [Lederbergia sp. NSJ-179]MCJ7840229.1 pilus assembly protein [Lederbergia sp. NSJ-179]
MKKQIYSFLKNDKGVFTIEASMIFPMLLIITLSLIFFSLVIYYKSVLQFDANRIADQVSYVWNNSSKDVKTGEFDTYTNDLDDGLYWRLTSNNILEQFGLPNIGDSSLVAKKEHAELIEEIPGPITGSVEFQNGLAGSRINVTLQQPLYLPSAVKTMFGIDLMRAQASRPITEPVEFIRNVDFILYFVNDISKYSGYISQFRSR